MGRKKKSKYTGELNNPIEINLRHKYKKQTRDEFLFSEFMKKFKLLFEFYDIEYDNWIALSFALAKNHVPGFEIIAPTPSMDKWEGDKGFKFVIEVEEIRKTQNLSIENAITVYIQKNNLSDGEFDNLRRRYYEAKDINTNHNSTTSFIYTEFEKLFPEIKSFDDFYKVSDSLYEDYKKQFISAKIND